MASPPPGFSPARTMNDGNPVQEGGIALMGKNRDLDSCLPVSSSFPPEISSPDYKIMPRRSVHKFALEILICRWRIVKLGPSTRLETLFVFVIINRSLSLFLLVVKIFFFLWFDRITIVDDYKLVFCNFPYAISNYRYARNNFLRNLFSTRGWISEIIRSREL